jgi:hypothetical protein
VCQCAVSVYAPEFVAVVVYGQECDCANCVDCDSDLGVCVYGWRGDVESKGDVGGECIFVGVPFESDECDWELCDAFC